MYKTETKQNELDDVELHHLKWTLPEPELYADFCGMLPLFSTWNHQTYIRNNFDEKI